MPDMRISIKTPWFFSGIEHYSLAPTSICSAQASDFLHSCETWLLARLLRTANLWKNSRVDASLNVTTFTPLSKIFIYPHYPSLFTTSSVIHIIWFTSFIMSILTVILCLEWLSNLGLGELSCKAKKIVNEMLHELVMQWEPTRTLVLKWIDIDRLAGYSLTVKPGWISMAGELSKYST